jgi:hypothetical protein
MSNEPLVTRANIVTVIGFLSAALIHTNQGAISAWLGANADLLAGVVLGVSPLVTALLSRKHVTPVSAPKGADGTPLVPANSVPPVSSLSPVDVQAALAAANEIHLA